MDVEQVKLTDKRMTVCGACVLLLEDDALISIDAEDMLLAIGAQQVRIAHSLQEGAAMLDSESFDAAVLDVLIGRETCDTLARELLARGIPFVFASGYGDQSVLSEDLRHIPQVLKPYSVDALVDAFATIGVAANAAPPAIANGS